MVFSRRLTKLLKICLVIATTFVFLKLIQNSDDDSAPRFDTNTLPPINETISNLSDGTQNTAILNLSHEPNFSSPINQKIIVESMEFLNFHHRILNVDKFGPLSAESVSVVLVVQVHSRPEYLSFLIESLRHARDINQTLVVFSHDLRSTEINDLIQNITFCRVVQIYYPHNIQLFPNIFPGQDSNDCPERISKDEAKSRKCNNWNYPDKYGNYRVAQLTQIKHHWWWKMNYVFDGIIKRYGLEQKYVLMLEEDHYLAPDALYILDSMIRDKENVCSDCEILCLGIYLKNYRTYANDINKLSVQIWFSSKHNMGFALNLETWQKIRSCSDLFCKDYDDYNWDWTLLQVSIKCLSARLRVIVAKAPRVIHIGDCGVHTHKCKPHDAAANARTLFESNKQLFFPQNVVRSEITKRTLKPSKPNGGWGDIRDHQLCIQNTFPYKPATETPIG
ncbi:Alpha-1,6-mannosyl-glycoprotein 2-beta-N-acetylglucosaminyltransferase [Aphelenchoides bicaudatus]|nr:Alpha-1,6-mannosyl-glycoprotein 2-beta-N-acetylglucosaminyltransferase [Aphelenchoides bicaudatus]